MNQNIELSKLRGPRAPLWVDPPGWCMPRTQIRMALNVLRECRAGGEVSGETMMEVSSSLGQMAGWAKQAGRWGRGARLDGLAMTARRLWCAIAQRSPMWPVIDEKFVMVRNCCWPGGDYAFLTGGTHPVTPDAPPVQGYYATLSPGTTSQNRHSSEGRE